MKLEGLGIDAPDDPPEVAMNKVIAAMDREDGATAVKLLQELIALNYSTAYCTLAKIYAVGAYGVEKDLDKAHGLAERAFALDRSPLAAAFLAKDYAGAGGYPKNDEKAFFYYSQIESYDAWPEALLRLGIMYQLGQGTEIDLEHARALYRRAAKLGNILARANWGVQEMKRGNVVRGRLLRLWALVSGLLADKNGPRFAAG